MKANELMLEDWVYSPEGELCKVHMIEGRFEAFVATDNYAHDDGTFYLYSIKEIRPVPLTAEILEKNGFWCQHNVGYVMEEGEYEIIYDLWNHNLRILKNREQILNLEYFDEMCVHELQHALRLCGIEKEIEL